MSDKKPYRIDENALREKLTSYTVSFNADSFCFLENEIAQVKTTNPIELPDTKKIIQFVGIPVAIGLFGCIVYFGVNYIKNLPPSPKKNTVIVTNPVVEPKIEVKKETPLPVITPSVAVTNEVKKQDTIVASVPQPIKIKEKKSTPVQIIPIKKDSGQVSAVAKTKLDSVDKKTKPDTSSVINKDTQPKKKKKKRKSLLDATEDIRQSQPNSADDDVVIPDTNPK